MRTIRRLIEAKKLEREENGESGFSLIELIIVVVILGILVAIAIPIFNGLQAQAKQSSLDTITANAASQVASKLAQDPSMTAAEAEATLTNFTSEPGAPTGLDLAVTASDTADVIGSFCVTGSATDLTDATSGPGCPSGGSTTATTAG